MTDCAASTLEAAVTAEMIMSAPRIASAAEPAQRTPAASPARRSFCPCALRKQNIPGRHRLHARLAQPCAMAWPASPKPMKAMAGTGWHRCVLPLNRHVRNVICAMMAGSPCGLQRCSRPIGCATTRQKSTQGGGRMTRTADQGEPP